MPDIWAEYNKIAEDERIALENIRDWQKILIPIQRAKRAAHEKAMAAHEKAMLETSKGAA